MVKLGLAAVLATGLAAGLVTVAGAQAGQQQAIPDGPRPNVIPEAAGVTPGKGITTSTSTDDGGNGGVVPGSSLPSSQHKNEVPEADQAAPDIKAELGPGGRVQTIHANVNFVQIPFTVKDKSGKLVPAIDWREIRVYENGIRQQLQYFASDPFPLSIAFVVDQSLPFDVMQRVNDALGAVKGAFTPYDEMAIFTYNNSTKMVTEYTGAQSNRALAAIDRAKSTGREAYLASPMGPLSQTTNINGHQFDPNTAPVRNSASTFQAPPKEQHPLNDAIFEAAKSLAKRPGERRRIIYVVSDGKEYGSKTKFKDVVQFLQTNKIAIYSTVVGDSATPYVGWLDKYHIPYTMRENVLPQYATATGGEAVSQWSRKGIEESFAKVAEDIRLQYTVGYYSHEAITDGKFRTVEVRVTRPDLNIVAKKGYYPTAENMMRTGGTTTTPQK
ncbi:VWA domain-containing protein [Terriglobus sp. TAA 43]|uniref:VWA domain-containing protein n=1 Tax=Terriglobus sp. TAA 43 TaxID=278961 RepID=UPI00064757AC|nr:VWA domain-containing protein [Terriglobus sp. TAA 43]